MIMALLGWFLLIVASVIPGVLGLLYQWDRIALSRAYFFIAVAICIIWWGFSWIKPTSQKQ